MLLWSCPRAGLESLESLTGLCPVRCHRGLEGFLQNLEGQREGPGQDPHCPGEFLTQVEVGWKLFHRAAASVLTARTGFLCRQGAPAGPHREEHPTQTPREPQGLSIGPTAELPPEEREGEASGVCAWLQMK